MTKKQFEIIKLIIVVGLSVTIGIAVVKDISFITPLAIIISALLIQILYRRVNEVTADERDYKLGGQAASLTLKISILIITALGGGLLAYSINNSTYYRPGYLLLYIASSMMVVNTISYLYYQKKG